MCMLSLCCNDRVAGSGYIQVDQGSRSLQKVFVCQRTSAENERKSPQCQRTQTQILDFPNIRPNCEQTPGLYYVNVSSALFKTTEQIKLAVRDEESVRGGSIKEVINHPVTPPRGGMGRLNHCSNVS